MAIILRLLAWRIYRDNLQFSREMKKRVLWHPCSTFSKYGNIGDASYFLLKIFVGTELVLYHCLMALLLKKMSGSHFYLKQLCFHINTWEVLLHVSTCLLRGTSIRLSFLMIKYGCDHIFFNLTETRYWNKETGASQCHAQHL